jgi:hypothetical protein
MDYVACLMILPLLAYMLHQDWRDAFDKRDRADSN